MTNAILQGKSDAGNPYAKNPRAKKLCAGVAALAVTALFAAKVAIAEPMDLNGENLTVTTLEGDYTNSSDKLAVLTLAHTSAVDYSGTISGNIQLKVTGTAAFRIRTNQSFTGGFVTGNGVKVYVYAEKSFGEPAVRQSGTGAEVYLNNSSTLCVMDYLTLAYNFRFGSEAIVKPDSSLTATGGEVVFDGDWYLYAGFQPQMSSAGVVRVKGKVYGASSSDYFKPGMNNVDEAIYHYEGGLQLGSARRLYNVNRGTVGLYSVPNVENTWKFAYLQSGHVKCFGTDVVPQNAGSYLQLCDGYGASLNLNGFDQTVPGIYSSNANHGHYIENSGKAATLTVNGTNGGTVFYGGIKGPTTFAFNVADKTYTLSGGTSTTTGGLEAQAGTLRLEGGAAFANLTKMTVKTGATLSVASGVSVNSAVMLTVEAGGTLHLDAGATLQTGAGSQVGETILRMGNYYTGDPDSTRPGAIYCAELDGTGEIYVPFTDVPDASATWDAGGADAMMDTKWNWEGDETPNLVNGGLLATFAAGSTALTPYAVALRGLLFRTTEESFTVSPSGDNQSVTLMGAGLVTERGEGVGIVQTNTIENSLVVAKPQPWVVGANTILELNGDVGSIGVSAVTKDGAGALHLRGHNTFFGEFVHSNGIVHVWTDDALGDSSTAYRIARTKGGQNTQLRLHGVTVTRPIIYHPLSGDDGIYTIYSADGTTNTLAGKITRTGGNAWTYVGSKSRLYVTGGVAGNWWRPKSAGDGQYWIKDTPITCSRLDVDNTTTTIYMDVTGNSCDWSFGGGCNATVRFMKPNVFNKDVATSFGTGGGITFELNGNDQRIGTLKSNIYGTGSTHVLTSGSPATLTVNQTDDELTYGDLWFRGALNLKKLGAKALQIRRPCSSTGTVDVTAGTLKFVKGSTAAATGSWTKMSELSVSGTGVVQLDHGGVISKATTVRLSDTGKLNLAEGVVQACGYLYRDGATRYEAPGTYGSSASPAQFKDDVHFSGTGVLKACLGGGVVIMIR